MSKRKFILHSILKTWLISTLISCVLLILFLNVTNEVRDVPRKCGMNGLASVFTVFWIQFLSILSLSSLFSLVKFFQGKIKTVLCWFLLPVTVSIYSFFMITDEKLSGEEAIVFLIMNLPWLAFWMFYYYRFNIRFNISNH
ncbi:hypothetical protein SAMN06265171_10877 [Chryseobacterium rhizoplanae]|uniref:Uncharacterized protein n=1 Tax=Chryseobacterium rhizoplanae TaxID=1609531 RepID=A0A521EHP3_9FLAO|nr:hypothetical protein [Chryseobacterium rhizoplanae]SMO83444.1 hypothetical protein SAMN06265171_10877 [Chryseobacterium rhizoplanae]